MPDLISQNNRALYRQQIHIQSLPGPSRMSMFLHHMHQPVQQHLYDFIHYSLVPSQTSTQREILILPCLRLLQHPQECA